MTLLAQEIIRRKRDDEILSVDELDFMVRGISDGSISEGQIAAFAMAVYFQGLNSAERVALTRSMTTSGNVLDWSQADLDGPVLDKHSTGGVGDKVSLVLAPMVAACGVYVPMISGRGLGHTGGTLDKLDSIPGYNTQPDIARLHAVVKQSGCAIIGQTTDLAPADKRFYAIRDVTATVESIGLITASILSKKLAAGIQGLVMDVKTGSGAFMPELSAAQELAHSIVDVAHGAGLRCSALITDMNQILGDNAGNALEVREALAYLDGSKRNARLHQVVMALAAEMLIVAGLFNDAEQAKAKLRAVLASGHAVECFAKMTTALGAASNFFECADAYLPKARTIVPVCASRSGTVCRIDTRAIGMTIVELGGGRRRASDTIDYAVGISDVCQLGDIVAQGETLLMLHAQDAESAASATQRLQAAIEIADEAALSKEIIYQTISA